MTLDRFTNVLIFVTLIQMMVAIGLGVTLSDLLLVIRNGRLFMRAMVANYLLVPAAAVGLLLLFDSPPMIAAGFLILAACPGAPYGPPLTAVARGAVPQSVGLMVVLCGSSALLSPLLIRFLFPIVSDDRGVAIDAFQIIRTLLITQLIPLACGIALRHMWPMGAARLEVPAQRLSKLLNVIVIVLIVFAQASLLLEIRFRGFAGMFVLLLASWAAGSLLGGRNAVDRKTMIITSSLRNISVGLVLATGSFPGTPAVTAVVAYGLISLFGSFAFALFLGRTMTPSDAIRATRAGP